MYSGFTDTSLGSEPMLQSSISSSTGGSIITVSNAAELTAALKSARGGETILLNAGTYDAVSVRGIQPAGNVTIASADPSAQAVLTGLVLRDSANITVRNVEMFDQSSTTVSDFRIQGSKNITFDAVKVHGQPGADGLDSQPFMIRESSNVTVSNSEFYDVRYGISMLNNNGVTITNNSFHDIRTDGIRSGGSSNVTIADNFFTNFHPAAGDHPDAIQFWTTNTTASAENITITGNAIVRGDGGAIQGIFMNDEKGYLPYKNVLISDNLVVGTMFNGIRVANAAGLAVTDNIVVGTPDQLSWIMVPAGTVLTGNGAERYQIGGVTVDFPAGNQMLPPSRDNGASLLRDWVSAHLSGGSILDAMTAAATAEAAPIPVLVIEGTIGADRLYAAKAEDSIVRGHEGNDKLYGQVVEATVHSRLEGGSGDDSYYIDTQRDTVVELANEGNDTVYASVDYTLTANVESLRLTTGGLTGHGNELDNKLIGSDGSDTFYGDAGNDSIQGLNGDDRLYGGDGDDRVSGDAGNDFLYGQAGNDSLIGGEGNDWLDGGDGNDRLEGGAGSDMLIGGKGADTFLFRQTDLGSTDTIADYNPNEDTISFNLIDANVLTPDKNEAFNFIGTANFSHKAGELRYTVVSDGVLVQGDVQGDGIADLSVKLVGIYHVDASNFML